MTITTETFTGANGSGPPSPWIAYTPSGTQNIQSNKWRMNSGGSYDGLAMTYGATSYTDVDITVELTTDTSGQEQYPAIGARLSGGSNGWTTYAEGYNGYLASLATVAGEFHIYKVAAGANAGGAFASVSITANTTYKLRFQLIGSALRAKVWAASGSEPGTWTVEAADPGGYTSGIIGFRDTSPSNTCISTWDTYTIDDAPGGGGGTLGAAASAFTLSATAVGTRTVTGAALAAIAFDAPALGFRTGVTGSGGAAAIPMIFAR